MCALSFILAFLSVYCEYPPVRFWCGHVESACFVIDYWIWTRIYTSTREYSEISLSRKKCM